MFDNENRCLYTIKDIKEQPDLGVHMDDSLKFEKQISNANGVLVSIYILMAGKILMCSV